MKHLFLTSVFALFLATNFLAQQTPPTPPKTNSTVSFSKGTSYSITFDTDDADDNSSISIKRNENVYKFNARFHESKTGSIKQLLIDKLGKSDLKIEGDTFKWIKNKKGQKLYECKLTENTLKIYVDKEYASTIFIEMMDDFGLLLKDTISGTDSKKENLKRAESELESAERELNRAKKELQRLKKQND